MQNLKLISVRIDPDTLAKIDKLAKEHYYWKRNSIINALLTAVVDTFDGGELYDMMRYSRLLEHQTEGSFKLWVPTSQSHSSK